MFVVLVRKKKLNLNYSVADPGSGAFLISGSGIRYGGSGSWMNNPNHISESLESIILVKMLQFFDADPGSGMKKFGSGIRDGRNRIRGKHPGSATPLNKMISNKKDLTRRRY
jgi:hypothetical protein